MLKEYAISNGMPSDKILVKKDVENTADEAMAVKELICPSKRIIIVTSADHANRAKRLFENQGFELMPFNVDYKVAGNSKLTLMDFFPRAVNLELIETGFREVIGIIYYLLRN